MGEESEDGSYGEGAASASGKRLVVRRVSIWAALGASTALAGLGFQRVGLPAAWLVGPMCVAVIFALALPKQELRIPRWGREVSQAVLGGVLAAEFRPGIIPLLAGEWPLLAFVVIGTVLMSLAAGRLLRTLAGIDGRTATLSMLPGAASGMVIMSESMGADTRLVAVAQYLRMLLVIVSATVVARFAVTPSGLGGPAHDLASGSTGVTTQFFFQGPWTTPLIAGLIAVMGAWLGARVLRLPAGALAGSLALGVLVKEFGLSPLGWPPIVPEAAYAAIGVFVGLLFDRRSLLEARRVLPYLLVATIGLMLGCSGLALTLTTLTGADALTAYLATTPGGIDSVAVIAVASGADASLVLAVQMLRLFAVMLAGLLVGGRLSRSRLANGSGDAGENG